jgi:hypothetical protein
MVVPELKGSSVMRDYRAYILGAGGRRFIKVEDFATDQPDDAAALNAAKQLVDGHDVELWDCGRLVARLSVNGEIASPELAPFTAAADASRADASKSDKNEMAPGKSPDGSSLRRLLSKARAEATENHLSLGW